MVNMDDTTIIVYNSNEKQIERYIEQEQFENATDEEIVRDLIDIHGEDIVITRVSYDEENLPSIYETLYETEENLSYKGRLAECSQPDLIEDKRAKTLLYNAMVMLEENIANTDGGFEEKLEMFESLLEELGMTLQEYQELMNNNGLYNEYKEQVECSEE
jgi:hypothetical protein